MLSAPSGDRPCFFPALVDALKNTGYEVEFGDDEGKCVVMGRFGVIELKLDRDGFLSVFVGFRSLGGNQVNKYTLHLQRKPADAWFSFLECMFSPYSLSYEDPLKDSHEGGRLCICSCDEKKGKNLSESYPKTPAGLADFLKTSLCKFDDLFLQRLEEMFDNMQKILKGGLMC